MFSMYSHIIWLILDYIIRKEKRARRGVALPGFFILVPTTKKKSSIYNRNNIYEITY